MRGAGYEAMYKPLPPIVETPAVLQQQFRTATDPKKRARLQALYLLASGQVASRQALAQVLAVHRHTIQTWLKLYEAGGLRALLTIRKAPGKRSSLTPAVWQDLRTQLAQPRGFGTYGEVRQYLARVHAIQLAYSTVHGLIRYKLGAKPKAPRRTHPKKIRPRSRSFKLRLARSSRGR